MSGAVALVERFSSRKKALDWLNGEGHKVSTGKFYKDCALGFPAVDKDGSLSKYQVLTYGLSLNKQVQPDSEALSSREWDLRKAKADAKMAEIKAEKMQRENDSLWLHADEAWGAVAGLVGSLRDCIRHHLYTAQRELVQIAGGEQERSQEVFEFADGVIDKAFNEVAGSSIDLKFGGE